jgi:hypothetical protein
MLNNLLSMTIIWITASFGYYLIIYQLKFVQGDIYINYIIFAISEIGAYNTASCMLSCFGLKNTLLLSYTIAIIGMLLMMFVKTDN